MLARGWVVRGVIALTLLLTLGMVSLIYIRWLTVQEPTATIVISGDPSLDGAQIILSPSPAGSVLPALDQSNDYTTPVHLQPGTYHLMVKLGDQTVFEGDVKDVNSLMTRDITLPTLLTVTGDPSDDDADVELSAPNGVPMHQVLGPLNKYKANWRLQPGTYNLTVLHNGATLYENPALVISLHVPVNIDLHQPRRGRD